MIEINGKRTLFKGHEYELFKDFMRFHAAVATHPELEQINKMAMDGVLKAAKDNMLSEILGPQQSFEDFLAEKYGKNLHEDNNG